MVNIIFLFKKLRVILSSKKELNDFEQWLNSNQAIELQNAYEQYGYTFEDLNY